MKTILFVENEPVVQTMCRGSLQREGFSIETASDGLAALKILADRRPDIAVLELRLGKLSGLDVLKFIRSNSRLNTVPVIMITDAHVMDPAQDAALANANRRFFKSECNAPILVQTIKDLITAPVPDPLAGGDAAIKLKMAKDIGGARPSVPHPAPPAAAPAALDPKLNRGDILKNVLAEITKIREYAMAYTKTPPPSPAGPENLAKLHAHVKSLQANALQAGFNRVIRITKAFDALLAEIIATPSRLTPSVPDTLVEASDCLGVLLKTDSVSSDPIMPGKVLAIDDDPVCNHAVVNALKRANVEAASVEDPVGGLKILESDPFDLVLLDINMPNLTGFEVAEKLRRMPNCKNTGIIFITGHNNFKNRTQGILSGGSDFITKPISSLELGLKVNIHLLKPRLHRVIPQTAEKPKPAPVAENPQPIVFVPAIEEPVIVPAIVEPPVVETPVVAHVEPVAPPVLEVPVVEEKPIEPVQPIEEVPIFEEPVQVEEPVVPALPALPTVMEMPISEQAVAEDRSQSVFLRREEAVVKPAKKIVPPAPVSVKKPIPAPPLVTPAPYKNGLTPVKKTSAPPYVPPQAKPKSSEVVRTNFFQTLARAAGNGTANLNHKTRNIPMKTDNNTFDKIAIEVTRIIFGDENVTEMNVRLVKIALERYNVHEMVGQSAEQPGRLAA